MGLEALLITLDCSPALGNFLHVWRGLENFGHRNKAPKNKGICVYPWLIASVHFMKALRDELCWCARRCSALPVAQLVPVGRARGALLIYCCVFHQAWLTASHHSVCLCVRMHLQTKVLVCWRTRVAVSVHLTCVWVRLAWPPADITVHLLARVANHLKNI